MTSSGVRKLNLIFILLFLALLISGSFYITRTHSNSLLKESERAILISQIAATGIDGEMIKQLQALPTDEGTTAFESVKKRLEAYLKADNRLRFVYLYTERNDRLYFMADSEPRSSANYSPPGQEYAEATAFYKEPFFTKESLITKPVTDRWGEWVSVLTPIVDERTGGVFAVLGMDYPASYWTAVPIRATAQAVLEILIALFLVSIIFLVFKKVIKKEEKFSSLIKNIPGAAFRCRLDKDWTMEFISGQIEAISGYPASDFINNNIRSYASIIYKKDAKLVVDIISKAVVKKENYTLEYRLQNKDKRTVWIKENGRAIYDYRGRPIFLDGIILDVSEDKEILTEVKNRQLELEQMTKFMVGRELKMIELKRQLKLNSDK